MPTTPASLTIADMLSPKSVKVPLQSTDKQSAIFELVDLLHAGGFIDDPNPLRAVVWEREQQRSTGIGEGLAIPHGKCPGMSNLMMAVGRPAAPIQYNSIDRKPVRLIILLASPPDRTADHIHALGRISRLMSSASFREAAFQTADAESLFRLLTSGAAGT